MAPKIHTPNPGVNAEIAGVAFTKGVGESDDEHALTYFRRHGYRIDEPEAPAFPDGDPAESWKADQLRAYAAKHNVEVKGATTKAEILAAIVAARTPATPPSNPDDQQS